MNTLTTDRKFGVSRTFDVKGQGSPVMLIRYRSWQGIATIVLSVSSAPVWAQLPTIKPAPLNQLGRSWGFGISDGYHECPECQKPKSVMRIAPPPSTVSHPTPCVDCEKKQSIFSKLNPFDDAATNSRSTTGRMTVLPPSSNMYQHFAAPHETPLPHSNGSSCNIQSAPSPTPMTEPGAFAHDSTSPSIGGPVPDPNDLNSIDSPSLQSESSPTLQPDTVPPPPVLRKRQKGDKPLGEVPESKPREPVPAEKTDDSLLDTSDDSLDLLPKDETPPITVHPNAKPGRSLISHTKTVPNTFPANPVLNSQEAILRQYYGQGYAHPMQSAQVPMETLIERAPTRSTLNRYR